MTKSEMEQLFTGYLNGSLSAGETEQLRRLSNESDDEQLQRLFAQCWDEYRPVESEANRKEVKRISKILNQKGRGGSKSSVWISLLRVAAGVLLLITTGLSAYLMLDNRKMSVLGEREVVVKVDKGQRVGITLPDGSTAQLNSETVLSYRQDFGKNDRRVKLSGEGFFEVVKNSRKKFVVNSSFMEVEVLGTSFNFYAYESKEEVEITLIEGKVSLSTHTNPVQYAMLEPNNKAVYNKRTGKLNIERTNTGFETAWRTHELTFRTESLENVFPRIARRYGVVFDVKSPRLLNEQYTGVFDNEELSDVLRILSTHFGFGYEIKSDSVSVY